MGFASSPGGPSCALVPPHSFIDGARIRWYMHEVDRLLPPGPCTIAMEYPTLHRRGALWGAGLFGAIASVLAGRGHRLIAVAPIQLKKFALGKVDGGKDEIRVAVYKRWRFEHPSNDVVDAYVLMKIARAVEVPTTCETQAQREVVDALTGVRGAKRRRVRGLSGLPAANGGHAVPPVQQRRVQKVPA